MIIFVVFWILQVEIQVRKIYCISRAIPNLPFNLEDAARSEAEFEKAEQVCKLHDPLPCIVFSRTALY